MKNLRTKIASLCLSLVLAATLIPNVIAHAATQNGAKETLTKYLTAVKGLDYDKAAPLYTDSRAVGNDTKESIFKEATSDASGQVKTFSVLNKEIALEDSLVLLAKVEFQNGEVAQIPFKLQQDNSNWVVRINPDLALESEYVVLKKGVEASDKTSIASNETLATAAITSTQKTNWYFALSGDWADVQYTSTFGLVSGQVEVNFRQWENYYGTANMQYAIVKKGVFSDTVYASGSVEQNNEDYADQLYLSVSSTLSGVCLRVKHLNPTFEAISWGEVYQ